MRSYKEKTTDINKIKLSLMSGKLKGIDSINTSPLINSFCLNSAKNNKSICSECYSIKMLKTYRRSSNAAWIKNTKILSNKLLTLNQIANIKLEKDLVRFHSHGELTNFIHLQNFVNIAAFNNDKIFTLWSKRIDLINKFCDLNNKPTNLFFIYSSPLINKDLKFNKTLRNFDKIFRVFTAQKYSSLKLNCGSKNCINCKLCYSNNQVKYINELIK